MNGQGTSVETSPHPTAILTSLLSRAVIARYDPSGKFIAGATLDGKCYLWDLDTKKYIRRMYGHSKQITNIDWSRNSRYLMTASKDWNIVIWDLATEAYEPKRRSTIRFHTPVQFAMFHPRNTKIILVHLSSGEVYIYDERSEERHTELVEPGVVEPAFTCAHFDPMGRYVFVGAARSGSARVLVFNTRTKKLVYQYDFSNTYTLKGFTFMKNGYHRLLHTPTTFGIRLQANCSDRMLRQFNLPATFPQEIPKELLETPERIEPKILCNDPISRVAWHNMTYSPDGRWLAGGSAEQAAHKIYIWDMHNEGSFEHALDGGREPLLDVTWHPKEPAIASTCKTGDILLWHHPEPEKWGAFAGGFEEFDENVVYEEREDEFDLEDESELAERKKREEDVEVDIMSNKETLNAREQEEKMARDKGDVDFLWAEEDPDDDEGWKMKFLMITADEEAAYNDDIFGYRRRN